MNETCPTCGGPCTRTIDSSVDDLGGPGCTNSYKYESLVKGEVVAEGTSCMFVDNPKLGAYWIVSNPPGGDKSNHFLVIRKEDSVKTGGKE